MKKTVTSIFVLLFTCISAVRAQTVISDTLKGLQGHTGDIDVVIFSPDGKQIASGGTDRTVKIFDVQSGEIVRNFSHSDEVISLAYSRDGKYLVSGSKDKTARIWQVDSNYMVAECAGHEGDVTGVAIDPRFRFVYTVCTDGNLRLYELRGKGKLFKSFPLGMPISSLALTHAGDIYVGHKNGQIRQIDFMGKEKKAWNAHSGDIYSLNYGFTKTNNYLISGSADNTAKIWDLKTGDEVKTLTGHTWKVNSAELSKDLKFAITGSNDGTCRLWEVETGKALAVLQGKGTVVRGAALSPDSKLAASVALVRGAAPEYIVYLWKTGLVPEKPAVDTLIKADSLKKVDSLKKTMTPKAPGQQQQPGVKKSPATPKPAPKKTRFVAVSPAREW